MTKLLLLMVSLVCLVPVLHAKSSSMDGNQLLDQCSQYEANALDWNAGMCGGFITGVESAYRFAIVTAHAKPTYCVPDKVTNGQLVKVASKYLKDNPQNLHYSAESLVVYALDQAFPCSEPGPPTK